LQNPEAVATVIVGQVDNPRLCREEVAEPSLTLPLQQTLANHLHRNPGQKPPFIIALSAFESDEDGREAAGIDLHLVKPVDPEELRRMFERLRQLLV
jgi:CheY-like chemotaxis protein